MGQRVSNTMFNPARCDHQPPGHRYGAPNSGSSASLDREMGTGRHSLSLLVAVLALGHACAAPPRTPRTDVAAPTRTHSDIANVKPAPEGVEGPPLAASSAEVVSPFHVVLESRSSPPTVSTLEGAAIVVEFAERDGGVSRAHVITEAGMTEQPFLLDGLREQAKSFGFPPNAAVPGRGGTLGFSGRYPEAIVRGFSTGADAPGACCSVTERWTKDQFVTVVEHASFPAWDSCDVRFYPFHVRWPNGIELWERLDCTDAGRHSTLFRDPDGKQRALRQRQHAKECGGQPRLAGAMSGVALPDGELLLAGLDCRTRRVTSEHFAGGATRSTLIELPGSPGEIYTGHVASSDPILWVQTGNGEVLLGFPAFVGQAPVRPYLARFDGKSWTDLSPPAATGLPIDFGRLADHGLWLLTRPVDFSATPEVQLWFDSSGAGSVYAEVFGPSGAHFNDEERMYWAHGQPFYPVTMSDGSQGLMLYGARGWESLPLPTRCDSCGSAPVTLQNLGFLGDEPVVALGAESCGCVARLRE